MNPFAKWWIVSAVILLMPVNSYYIGTIFDDYCWYGQIIYLGSDKPPKCLTQTEHDEIFTGEFWEQLEDKEIQFSESGSH